MMMEPDSSPAGRRPKRRLPRSFKELTPSNHFNPRTFFYEMVWKAWFTRRAGASKKPQYPKLETGQVGLTWIGHACFLVQFTDMNLLIDPNFANWIFLLKRLRSVGVKVNDLPPVDLVLISHAHFDHFHKQSLRKLPVSSRTAVVPWGMGELVRGLGFEQIVELKWWESFARGGLKVTLTPSKHWGARMLHDEHRGYGGFLVEHQGRTIYHAGDSAYSDCFKQIGERCAIDLALLPIGAYYPDSFRHVHMGPDEALKVFREIGARTFIPMHYGSFKLAFEDMDEPLRWLRELVERDEMTGSLRVLEEGVPEVL